MNTTVIHVDAVSDGKVIASAHRSLNGWHRLTDLQKEIGETVYCAAQWAAPKFIDMTMPQTSFNVTIRHLRDSHM